MTLHVHVYYFTFTHKESFDDYEMRNSPHQFLSKHLLPPEAASDKTGVSGQGSSLNLLEILLIISPVIGAALLTLTLLFIARRRASKNQVIIIYNFIFILASPISAVSTQLVNRSRTLHQYLILSDNHKLEFCDLINRYHLQTDTTMLEAELLGGSKVGDRKSNFSNLDTEQVELMLNERTVISPT